jgi:hypothetical protein
MALEKKLNCTKGQKQALDYIYIYIYKFTFDLITVLKSLLDSLDTNSYTLNTHELFIRLFLNFYM